MVVQFQSRSPSPPLSPSIQNLPPRTSMPPSTSMNRPPVAPSSLRSAGSPDSGAPVRKVASYSDFLNSPSSHSPGYKSPPSPAASPASPESTASRIRNPLAGYSTSQPSMKGSIKSPYASAASPGSPGSYNAVARMNFNDPPPLMSPMSREGSYQDVEVFIRGRQGGDVMGLDRFDLKEVLGEGSFSKCQKALDKQTGQIVAVKTYKAQNAGVDTRLKRQIKILKELEAPLSKASVKDPRLWHEDLYGRDLFLELLAHSGPQDSMPYVVTEMAQYSLKNYLREQTLRLPIQEVRQISRALVLAVAGFHAKSLVHLDIKPENFMLFGTTWKLIDVEGSVHDGKQVPADAAFLAFSPIYCAPEWAKADIQRQQMRIAKRGCDVWSVGMSIAEVASLKAPLKEMHEEYKRRGQSKDQASQLVMQYLASMSGLPMLPDTVSYGDGSLDTLLSHWLLVPNATQRKELVECLDQDFLSLEGEVQTERKMTHRRIKSAPNANAGGSWKWQNAMRGLPYE